MSELTRQITISSTIGQPHLLKGDVPFTVIPANYDNQNPNLNIFHAFDAVRRSGGNGIAVVPDTEYENLLGLDDTKGIEMISAERVLDIIDRSLFQEIYGINLDQVSNEGKVLLASSILKDVFNQEPVAMLGSDVRKDTNPLAWMSWAAEKSGNGVAISQNISTESRSIAMANVRMNKHPGINQLGTDQTGIHKHTIENQSGLLLPNSTTTEGQALIQTIARGEFHPRDQFTQVRVLKDNANPNRFGDKQLDILNVLMNELRTVNLTELTPDHIRNMNEMMAYIEGIQLDEDTQAENLILPSVKSMFYEGVINQQKYTYLIGDINQRQWHRYSRERAQSRDISGEIIPNHETTTFGEILKKASNYVNGLHGQTLSQVRKVLFRDNPESNNRPMYGLVDLPAEIRDVVTHMVYNIGPKGYREPFNMWGDEDEVKNIREKSLNYLKGTHTNNQTGKEVANVKVIVPFVGETTSLYRTTRYAAIRVGAQNVIATSARGNTQAEESIEADLSDEILTRQSDQLAKYDWIAMEAAGLVPKGSINYDTGLPIGLKSLTMLSGMIELMEAEEREEIDDETWVAFYDSDIINPGELNEEELGPDEKRLARPENWYDALMYMGIAMEDGETKGVRAVHTARSGAGRNNQTVHYVMDLFVNSKNEKVRKLGLAMSPFIWPLTGERAYKWGDLKKMIWAKDMFIETMLDLNTAGRDATDGIRRTAQVIIPVQKLECAHSDPAREWGMLNALAKALNVVLGQMGKEEISSDPMKWSEDEMQRAQEAMGDERFNIQFVTMDDGNVQAPRVMHLAIGDNVMPSLEMMQKYRKNAA